MDNQQAKITDLTGAIKVFEDLLFEFAIRSGGGYDCLLINQAEEALTFLRSMREQQGQGTGKSSVNQ